MRKNALSVEGESTPRPSRQQRRSFKREPSRQILNALTFQAHLSLLLDDLEHPEGLRSNSALLELTRLAPSAARILATIEALLETCPETLRGELQDAHDQAWCALEYGIEAEEKRAA